MRIWHDFKDVFTGRLNKRFAATSVASEESLKYSLQKLEQQVSEAVRHTTERTVRLRQRDLELNGDANEPLSQ